MTEAAARAPHRGVVAAAREVRSAWRRSLQTRVVTSTLLFSVIVVGLLGLLLLSRVTSGLLEAKQRSSVGEATAGLGEAQRLLEAADTGPTTPSPSRLVDSVVSALASRSGSPGQFEVLLLSSQPRGSGDAPERGSNLVSEASVPRDLRVAVVTSQRQSWTFSEIRYLDGRTVPGLVVGAPLGVPTVGSYELYHLFPLDQEQATLDLVRSTVLGTAFLLVLGLGIVALIVTRQVVTPVRQAARTARRLSEGHLSERVEVRGEDDLAQLAASFNDMAASLEDQIDQLRRLSELQQRFVSDVSHELRTPLTTIRMAADVLHEVSGQFDPAARRSAELLQTQLDRFEALLTDLLEISRFDAGAAVLDLEAIDVRDLARRVVDGAVPLAERRGVDLRLAVPDEVCDAECDPRRIDRVIRNLVVNAIEHAEGRPVEVTVGVAADAVAVVVRDHGAGLRPGEAALVFNRFWRADPARARSTGGTGLGLSIALEDARLHGGWLEAWGSPGDGASFRLTLPRTVDIDLVDSPLALEPADAREDSGVPVSAPFRGGPRARAGDPAGPGPEAGAPAGPGPEAEAKPVVRGVRI